MWMALGHRRLQHFRHLNAYSILYMGAKHTDRHPGMHTHTHRTHITNKLNLLNIISSVLFLSSYINSSFDDIRTLKLTLRTFRGRNIDDQ